MTTFNIDNYSVTITDELQDAFLALHAYISMPAKTKYRLDPKCKQYQWLIDNFISAFRDTFEASLDDLTDEEYDIAMNDYFDTFIDDNNGEMDIVLEKLASIVLETV